jgi:hypothetical protein
MNGKTKNKNLLKKWKIIRRKNFGKRTVKSRKTFLVFSALRKGIGLRQVVNDIAGLGADISKSWNRKEQLGYQVDIEHRKIERNQKAHSEYRDIQIRVNYLMAEDE